MEVVRLHTSLSLHVFAEVPRGRAATGVSREMHQGEFNRESVQQGLPSSSVLYQCHVSARNLPATLAPQRMKLRHPAIQAGWEKVSSSRLETGTSRAICAMARAWRLLAGGHLKRDATHRVKHSEQLPTKSGTLLSTAVHEPKDLVRRDLKHRGIQENKHVDDRSDLPVVFRFMAPVLETAEDPELLFRISQEESVSDLNLGSSGSQRFTNPRGSGGGPSGRTGRTDSVRQGNNSSLSELADNVVEVMDNQESRAKSSSVQKFRRRIRSPWWASSFSSGHPRWASLSGERNGAHGGGRYSELSLRRGSRADQVCGRCVGVREAPSGALL